MRRSTLSLLAITGAYILGVCLDGLLITNAPKFARYFAPPFFQFSASIRQGRAAPFDVGMSEARALAAAKSAGLITRPCAPELKLEPPYDFPATLCFAYPTTGTFWDVWIADRSVVVVHIYTTFNVTSE